MENENNNYSFGSGTQPEVGASQDNQTFGAPQDNQSYGAPQDNQSYGAPQDNQSYGVPQDNQTFGEQNYGAQQDNQAFGQQSYGNNQNFGQQSYGNDQAFGQQSYGNDQAFGQQSYGNDQSFGQQSYGNNQTFGQQNYGQANYGFNGGAPLNKNGQPMKNRFGMKLTFSILEMISCSPLALIFGIIGCIFTVKANSSYKSGKWEEFKSQAKTSAVMLWIGLAGVVLVWAYLIFCIVLGVGMYSEMEDAGLLDSYYDDYDYDYDDYDFDYDYDFDDLDLDDYDFDFDDASEDESEAAEDVEDDSDAASVDIIPGDGFVDPSITIEGVYVTLPTTYAELEAAGLVLEQEDKEYIINKNEYNTPSIYTADGKDIGYVYIGNVTDQAIATEDGIVFGFWLSGLTYDDGASFSLGNGVTEKSTNADVKAAFGEPDYEYESEDNDYQSYTWYNHSDEYYDMDENSIEINFWEGEMDDITIRYIGWD